LPASDAACSVEKGNAEDTIIEKTASDKTMLIAMATHGRSGLNRFLLGSVAEKVLRGTVNPLLLIALPRRPSQRVERTLKSVIVPLDGIRACRRGAADGCCSFVRLESHSAISRGDSQEPVHRPR
jgi:hypothetical protein